MKAIYLNLDDAVRAVCAGRKVVQSILPLAVTIPAGQAAAVYAQTGTAAKTDDAGSAVTAVAWSFSPSLGDAIATGVAPGMSQVLASETASVYAVAGDSLVATAAIKNGDTVLATVVITVIVNREQAQGPVDLVEFTPPASGGGGELTADAINRALGGTGAVDRAPLAGVSLGKANIVATNTDGATTFTVADGSDPILIMADSGSAMGAALGAASAS